MYERCSVCGWRFEREPGYWTGAVALNLVVTELLIAIVIVPLAIWLALTQQPITLLIVIGLPLPFILPFLFFRHAKSFWMSIDFRIHPVDPEERRWLLGSIKRLEILSLRLLHLIEHGADL